MSLASTTQLYNPQTKTWSKKLLDALKLREDMFAPICASGTKLGPMKKNLATEVGLPQIEVIASCSHDTGAAVAAVPASGENWAYLSSGTWSLMGVEWPQPVINDQARSLALHERNRLRRFRSPAEKHRRPLDRAGMSPAMGKGRQKI